MARVAPRAGRRGRTIPAPREPGSVGRGDPRLRHRVGGAWTLGSGAGHPGMPGDGAERGESGQVRRTAAIIAAGALVFLAGCSGDEGGGSGSGGKADAAAPAHVSLALADGSADVSPATPLEVAVTDGKLGKVTVVDGAGTEVPGAV